MADEWYELEMNFAELQISKELKQLNVNNLGQDVHEKTIGERIFDVKVNDEVVLKDSNISKEVGEASAYKIKIRASAKNNQGINITFDKKVGEPVLNGVRVRKI
ncbi:MAG: hypothetical protein GZ091_09365 [Paludibacter sp.]|nr:hypothetical protein [Paludibacter sp.]